MAALEAPPMEASLSAKSDDDSEVYIPGLTDASIFTSLPPTDSLTALLEKYVAPNQRPTRDLTGQYGTHTLEELIESQNWRAIATYARDWILNTSTDQTSVLLAHWSLRLHALLRLHLVPSLVAELSTLFSLLPQPGTLPTSPLFHPAIPFELLVLRAALPGLRGGGREDAVEGLAELLRGAKSEFWMRRRAEDGGSEVWRERVTRIGVLIEGLLIEMKAGPSASNVITSDPGHSSSPSLLRALCRQHYATGNFDALRIAEAALSNVPEGAEPRSVEETRQTRKAVALGKVAEGAWVEAEQAFRALLEEDKTDLESINNLAVVLLYQARLNEALSLLTTALTDQPKLAYHSEPILFNLATLQELRTEQAVGAKVKVLRDLSGSAGGGGQAIRSGCLKLAA